MRHASMLYLAVFLFVLVPHAVAQDERPLSHVREGGTPYDAEQALVPYSLQAPAKLAMPGSGLISCPAEYEPMRGVMFCWKTGQWTDIVTQMVVGLTSDPAHDEIAYVVVSASQQTAATNAFTAGGADMSKVFFFNYTCDALWIRDYGPHFIFQDGALALVDSHYYPERPRDNFTPTKIGDDYMGVPTYDMGLYYSGGNFQPGPNRSAFMSALVRLDNPPAEGFTDQVISDLYSQYQGIDTLHIMPQLPFSVDGTGHIDMWMYIVDEDDVIISEFKPGSDATAIRITNDAVPYMEDLGFTVHRTPAWNSGYTHWTYTNAFRVNDRIFIIEYGGYPTESAEALAAWQAAAGPDVELIVIDCTSIIGAAGAMHCIVMQVPRYVGEAPAACVLWPDGDELLVSGMTRTIKWAASDTDNVEIPQIDLYYSVNDGGDWEFIATTADTGSYEWLVPDVETTEALIKVVATSNDTDQGEGISAGVFQIADAQQSLYDFTAGGGVDKFGFGSYTTSWINVDGVRTPVSADITTVLANAYARLSASDATGGDTDVNRYISTIPSSSRESTHVFEITIDEDPAEINDIQILWEGYADNCTQVELMVWDYVEGNWGNARGDFGINAYMDNYAGNRDEELTGEIIANFDRYIDAAGVMTLLVYAERGGDESFHDYLAVTVTTGVSGAIPGDIDGDGDVDLSDLAALLASYGKTAGDPGFNPDADLDGDGDVDLSDLAELLSNYGS